MDVALNDDDNALLNMESNHTRINLAARVVDLYNCTSYINRRVNTLLEVSLDDCCTLVDAAAVNDFLFLELG